MNDSEILFLSVLRAAVHDTDFPFSPDRNESRELRALARKHNVLPLIVDKLCDSPGGKTLYPHSLKCAGKMTCAQAQRTADFLLLCDFLRERGLYPVIVKGIVIRSLYPHPEQRSSADEDILIRPEEFSAYDAALREYGLSRVVQDDPAGAYEISYEDKSRGLYIEIHRQFFPPSSQAYGKLNRYFDHVLSEKDRKAGKYCVRIYGQDIYTLWPTEHMLYLIFHAYKHFLHGGIGIRQICDIGIFADRFGSSRSSVDGTEGQIGQRDDKDECSAAIDWDYILMACRETGIDIFAAAMFRIAAHELGFQVPVQFRRTDIDEIPLLEDVLSGGIYGVNDINRAHSATITLNSVAAYKRGIKHPGLAGSIFLPLHSMSGRYRYLRKHPWLLPVAWVQRAGSYLMHREKSVDPVESVRIGQSRVMLLKEYGIIK